MTAPIRKVSPMARRSAAGLGCDETEARNAGTSKAEKSMFGCPEESDLTSWQY